MKQLFTLLIVLLVAPFALQAQVKVGDNLANINANSLLELESTTKALLLPRLNQTQIDAMQNVPAGMLVYNSSTNLLNIRTNAGWVTLSMAANASSATNPWLTTSSTAYTSKSIGIGTSTPSEALEVNGNIKYSGLLQMGVQYVFDDFDFPGNSNGLLTKSCPAGTKLIGGGGGLSGNNAYINLFSLAYSGPQKDNNNNWLITAYNSSSVTLPFRIYAICAKVQ